jgi:quercetin dioxygenase-like cupin family protein
VITPIDTLRRGQPMSSTLGRIEDLPLDYREGLRSRNLMPLWPSLRAALPYGKPTRSTTPTLWRYRELRPDLMRAGELTPIEKAERRVLVLCNPGLGLEQLKATPSIYVGLQLILPGETAPNHLHTPSAVRFVIEGEGGYTVVRGEKLPMHRGDLILTPAGLWHQHGHEGQGPVVWLDALDLPVVYGLEASYCTEGPPQSVVDADSPASRRFRQAGVLPYGAPLPARPASASFKTKNMRQVRRLLRVQLQHPRRLHHAARDGAHAVIAATGCGIITNQGAYPDPLGEGKSYFRQVAIFDDKFLPQFETIARYIHDGGAVGDPADPACRPLRRHRPRLLRAALGGAADPAALPPAARADQGADQGRRPAARRRRQARHPRRLRRHRGHQLHGLPAGQLQLPLHQPAHRRVRRLARVNRGRFMRELIDAIKQATPEHPLVIRLNGAELMDRWGGNSEDDCFELMQQAVDCGVDMISVTVGWQEAPESSIGRDVPPGHWNYLSAKAKKLFPEHADHLRQPAARPAHGRRLRARRRVRLLGGLPPAAGRPRADPQGGRGPARRGAALHRLAELPVAPVPRPALHLHHEPGARPRGGARVPGDAGGGEEEGDGDRRRPGRAWNAPSPPPGAATTSPCSTRRRASAATCMPTP